jgi:hypothetical protein
MGSLGSNFFVTIEFSNAASHSSGTPWTCSRRKENEDRKEKKVRAGARQDDVIEEDASAGRRDVPLRSSTQGGAMNRQLHRHFAFTSTMFLWTRKVDLRSARPEMVLEGADEAGGSQ